ncbi:TPA: alanine/glycine:cation symporter family protein [Pseudomonas aeruginosa]|uniref:alanine/glycine:cation symporter family protein n=1 Tax=Pseudomonas TaxID=286 RepID=UPI00093A36E2|nr:MULTISPECIES: alanine/glycine:cation symporter family protein [Pseudomonas]MBT9570200.1 alanine:cation symporter family protein [Pseudomonas umsongensis]EKX2956994.1 alanine:cation symporter family protein [Pseudomonas aeruginosa]MBG4113908.1 alanine:cation symporter family protein [Pseudomonas aeruginosa]MBI6936962.1 alanine:cation symporter family protein [Pseudomonas aeruginosa]MBI7544820.1 alanine:cation symporter family protein [Pseudomonas aeruginosa]
MEFLVTLNEWIWNPLIVMILGFGLFLTVITKCLQIRRLPDMLRLLMTDGSGESGISSFQAFTLTLSSRVGVGTVAGVATAVAAGGPGALFWMCVMAFLGGATAFIESTLAQVYKTRIDGRFRGGIPYYIEKGLNMKGLAIVAALMAITLYAVLAPGIQSNNIASSFKSAFDFEPLYTAITVSAVLAFIIFGNPQRLIKYVERVVPLVATTYVLVAIAILVMNADAVPGAFRLIFESAIGQDSVFGGIVGSAIAWGVRRALFCNVAGVGEGTYGSAAAEVSHPAKQGLVQCFSIYVDTIIVCMATGLMIVVTGCYNVFDKAGGVIVKNLDVEAGPAFTQAAIDSTFPGFGGAFVAIAIAFFAFSTLVAFYYICESNLFYLQKGRGKVSVFVLRVVMVTMVFFGAVKSAKFIWALGDVGYASLAWLNMICLLFLAKQALVCLRDYDRQRKLGIDPVFNPVALGIKNADYWLQGKSAHQGKGADQSIDRQELGLEVSGR